jgi:hypothetical protein
MAEESKGWMSEEAARERKSGTAGSLRKALHVKAGQKIPAKKLAKAAHSENPKMRRKANMAKMFKRSRKS